MEKEKLEAPVTVLFTEKEVYEIERTADALDINRSQLIRRATRKEVRRLQKANRLPVSPEAPAKVS